jgi:arsenate reductase-like glutaredoxin family protein
MEKEIKLYGSIKCHKTKYYISELEKYNLNFRFLDVVENEKYAGELRSLYLTRRLNFPTIMLGDKKLRNPNDSDLKKWLLKKGYIKEQ